ncbi:unnamed protein product [Adineta steineri]|uniref:Alanine racemase-like protein n=1 Tax=Adineta steineri TaxID=433720 RepID=A0A813TQD0_9BILA|nr:unnamed protein product [Adineta steineri]
MFFFFTVSFLIGWITLKWFLSRLYASSSPSNINLKLFQDFNQLFLLKDDKVNHNINLHHLPAVLVDLNAFDKNISFLRDQMSVHSQTTIRIASKSIRVPFLLQRILSTGHPYKGTMCYAVEEAEFLSSLGFDDFLIAYPTQQILDYEILRNLHDKQKRKVSIVVDHIQFIGELNEFMTGIDRPFPIILEFDGSYRMLGGYIHIGARRSPIRTISHLIDIIEMIKKLKFVQLEGLMLYESHIAGVGDINPNNFWLNPFIYCMKHFSILKIQQLRKALSHICLKYDLKIFNGGGTGSFMSTLSESSVLTEITIGSGFFQPHLFDYYQQNQLMIREFGSTFVPSCYFALPVVRISDDNEWITCSGGGYIASGRSGWDKLPIPVYPLGLTLSVSEGAGEVQTPLKIHSSTKDESMKILKQNKIVYFRHAKGGELAERFNSFLIVNNGRVIEIAKTYRGYGKCFF